MRKTPPPSVWPENVNRLIRRDANGDEIHDPILMEIRECMRRMKEACTNMVGVSQAILANPTELPAKRALQNSEKMQALMQAIAPSIDKSLQNVKKVIGNLEGEMAVPKPDLMDPLRRLEESEIRQALLRMSDKDRDAAIASDEAFLIATLNSSPFLTGVHPARHKALLAEWRGTRHPEKSDHVKRLTAAEKVLGVAAENMVQFVAELSRTPELEAAGRSERAAREALSS